MKVSLKNIVATLALLISPLAMADTNTPYTFRHLDIVDGMSDNQIRGLTMLPDKRLAVQTASILNIYNGATFEHFYYDKNREYKWNYWGGVKDYADHKNRLWIKERDHLLLLDLNTNQFIYNIDNELADMGINFAIKNLFVDDEKNIWVTGTDNTVAYYQYTTDELVTVTPGNSELAAQYGVPKEMAQYKNLCWMVYSSGMIRCWDYYSQEFVSQETAFVGRINEHTDRLSIHTTPTGDVWLMYNGAVLYYDRLNQRWTTVATIAGRSNFFTCMDIDSQGNAWVGTSLSGLRFINGSTFEVTVMPYIKLDNGGELANDIYTIFVDPNDGVWVGTLFQGLCYYQPSMRKFKLVQTMKKETLLTNESVRCFLEEPDGSILVGTGKGVFSFQPTTGRVTRVHPQLADELCMHLSRDAQGRLWVCTFLSGLYCIEGTNVRNYKWLTNNESETTYNTARYMYQDNDGRYWVSINRGIGEFFPSNGRVEMLYEKQPRILEYAPAVVNYTVNYEIFPQGEKTFGVIGEGGIFFYNTETDSLYLPQANMPETLQYAGRNTRYYCIFTDSRGLEWQATEIGVSIWDGRQKTLQNITVDDGLPSNTVSAFLEDKNGMIWASTANGICRIEVKQEAGRRVLSIVNFGVFEGLQSGKFYSQSVLQAADGTMYFGGVHGFNYFNPEAIVYNNSVNVPVFTAFGLFNKPVRVGAEVGGNILLTHPINITQEIELGHRDNFISLEFAGLNYVNPAQTYFRYKLEGFDHGWTELVTNGSGRVTYTSLRPGTYKLIVYTANNDKLWGATPAEMTLIIRPPFWVTGWAFIVYLLAISFIGAYLLRTFRIRSEKRLREQQETNIRRQREELNQIKFRFFTNISHEFRTPLTLIITPLEALIKEETNLRLKNKLISIQRNARDLLTLVNQLLDFRKLEMKGEALTLSKHNIVSFVENVYVQFKDTITAKSLEFTINSSKEAIILSFDKDKMHKVLNNLLSNALKYTPNGGDIALTIDTVTEAGRNYVRIDIADTGEGIEAADLDKIFDRFYQSDTQDYSYAGSSGIGLHLVREYLDMHQGRITVTSQKGKGSTFSVFLPADLASTTPAEVAPDATEEAIQPEVVENHPTGKTILVVEDNTEFRTFLAEQLSADFNVIEAEDGEVGEAMALKHSPDLIISDLMMPKTDGITLCRRLKTNIQTSHIPFILLTARSSDEAKTDGYDAGADSYISKPFNFDMLMVRIRKLIEQQEKRQELFHKTIEVKPGSITITSLDEEFIQKALACVEKNIDNTEYSIEDLSNDVGLHRSHLYRKVQSITGQTPIDFMRSIRLKRAAQLLTGSQYRISEIADMVGFNTIKYFNKYFKEEFGMTPTGYRSEKGEGGGS